jgi:hypothetical protein
MNSRHLLYVLYTLSFLHELKQKDLQSYEELENLKLNIPVPIFCQILDGIFYYKSYFYVFKVLIKWQMREEEKKLRGVPSLNHINLEMHHTIKDKANTLANWSKEWSNRFNK